MQWHSAAEFFEMGGYALYVWGSLGACALGMLIEPLMVMQRRRNIERELRREQISQRMAGASA